MLGDAERFMEVRTKLCEAVSTHYGVGPLDADDISRDTFSKLQEGLSSTAGGGAEKGLVTVEEVQAWILRQGAYAHDVVYKLLPVAYPTFSFLVFGETTSAGKTKGKTKASGWIVQHKFMLQKHSGATLRHDARTLAEVVRILHLPSQQHYKLLVPPDTAARASTVTVGRCQVFIFHSPRTLRLCRGRMLL